MIADPLALHPVRPHPAGPAPGPEPAPDADAPPIPAGAGRALALATLGFALNCWAWALLSPLAPVLVDRGTIRDTALVVAIPVLVGSLGRIPVGALTDRLGGRVMLPLLTLASVLPVLYLGLFGLEHRVSLLLGGLFLGIAGTTFAVGIPYVNSWFPPGRRGRALGIFGMSMGGTAISAFTTVPLVRGIGDQAPFLLAAAVLVLYAAAAWRWMPTAPGWRPARGDLLARTVRAARAPVSLPASYLYAISFGGYVAFGVALPTVLRTWYGLDPLAASLGMAAFVLTAVAMRPLGGAAADRFGAGRTLAFSYLAVALGAMLLATHPPLAGSGAATLLLLAAGLGLGTGAVFGLVAQVSDPAAVGAITGLVGAAGGLGGFVPPLVLAAVLSATGSYAGAFVLLALAAAAALGVTGAVVRERRRRMPAPLPA